MTNTAPPSVVVNCTEGGSEAVEDSLNLRGVGKEFGVGKKRYYVLENINLTVPRGELLCLLGPSGCGKSTLLNIIAGFVQANSGKVTFGSRDITGPGPSRVMLFQDSLSALFPWLTAQDNVEFGLCLRGVPALERHSTADKYLTMVGLDAHRHKFPHEMSGGMRQRLQIARALVTNPDMLLMDEPFGALDALTRRNMHRALLEVWERTRKTVIFVTHDIAESLLLADRIAVMSIGPRSIIRNLIDLRHLARPRDPSMPGFGAAYSEIERLLNADPNMGELG